MKAISIHPEYCDMIDSGEKDEEYRSWPTKYRGLILIVSTAMKDFPGFCNMVADLYDCVPMADGGYAFKLQDIHNVKPFVVKGQQRIYNVDITPEELEYIDDDDDETYHRTSNEFIERVKAGIEKIRA
jgi:hypothetical protein